DQRRHLLALEAHAARLGGAPRRREFRGGTSQRGGDEQRSDKGAEPKPRRERHLPILTRRRGSALRKLTVAVQSYQFTVAVHNSQFRVHSAQFRVAVSMVSFSSGRYSPRRGQRGGGNASRAR